MQLLLLQNLGWILLVIGILLVCISAISASKDSASEDSDTRTKSKGVIFLGPIPIVWGYGKKGWMIAGAIGIILLLVWVLAFL
ncbi:MAG: TIGR00304 family membrane protein [Candidatus Thorarchaeota archaeon]